MSRLTITLEDSLHLSLKEAAVRQGRSIGKIIEESLLLRGIRPMKSSQEILGKARTHAKNKANLNDADAMTLALDETNKSRQQ
jgi:hypothetical protein